MPNRLDGKVAVITGTGSGIGKASALLFAAEGAAVVGADTHEARGASVAAQARAFGGRMESLQPVDLSRPDGARRLTEFALEKFGRIDILFNNAGVAIPAPVGEMSYDSFAADIRGEVDIVFHLTREVWPHFVANGGGVLLNTASSLARTGDPIWGALAHCAAKGAVLAMTRQYAVEGAKVGIRANTVSPGLTRTGQTGGQLAAGLFDDYVAMIPMGRVGEPDEIATAALYLVSDEARYVTGADYAVDGGLTAV
ncbi:SDR family oxidoreductase [Nocardia sp. 2]|uniref:SDR family oxidoreductase n=1 Tax=Nocardia acididurans TaxID=2802282 RepID=A0ABS1MH44_9NOCA|nr:SDR family NAD(P)-dependent oxidoreductase [Nocardia acididurans]MBL1079937.1 SDR family oxidoreductase [Nocardia acididurans]